MNSIVYLRLDSQITLMEDLSSVGRPKYRNVTHLGPRSFIRRMHLSVELVQSHSRWRKSIDLAWSVPKTRQHNRRLERLKGRFSLKFRSCSPDCLSGGCECDDWSSLAIMWYGNSAPWNTMARLKSVFCSNQGVVPPTHFLGHRGRSTPS